MPAKQKRMTEVRGQVRASPERVFAELSDGWAYVGWVVGASDIADFTESLTCEPDRLLRLRARGWPLGEAIVEIQLEPVGPSATEVTIREAPSALRAA